MARRTRGRSQHGSRRSSARTCRPGSTNGELPAGLGRPGRRRIFDKVKALGRVAQRESTRFTREGSLVRSQPRPLNLAVRKPERAGQRRRARSSRQRATRVESVKIVVLAGGSAQKPTSVVTI